GVVIFLRSSRWSSVERLVAATLPLGFLILTAAFVRCVLRASLFAWNAARLAPTFALAHGYRLYYGPNSGPVLDTIYGPVTALIYLPATLAHLPTDAVIIGSVVSSVLYFGPVAWLFVWEPGRGP